MELSTANLLQNSKKLVNKVVLSKSLIDENILFSGPNLDFTENYFWHLNFAYFTGKGYRGLKLEDHHYFSEASQYGQNFRQLKGGSIRAFQENFNQLISLVKVHLMPLLKEVKQAHEIKRWFNRITYNDDLLYEELQKKNPNQDLIKKYRNERNEAISHLKDRWVTEIDQSRLWTISRSAAEGGLDFVLLPNLFFGTALDDPFERKKSLKQQLDEDIYKVDVTQELLSKLANFQYRFYTWLPTAIRDTDISFKIKIATLKQHYTQLQMQIKFLKPLLIEISRKSESLHSSHFFKNFELENPEFVTMFDYSYSYIRIVAPRNFDIRGPHKLTDLEFGKYGFYIDKEDLKFGKYAGESGIIFDCDKTVTQVISSSAYPGKENEHLINSYKMKLFSGSREEANKLTSKEFNQLKEVIIYNSDLKKYPVMEMEFSQKRKNRLEQTPQGPQILPYMNNNILYNGYAWSLIELAVYREKLKIEDVKLLDTFIEELAVVRDELLYYANYSAEFDETGKEEYPFLKKRTPKKTEEKNEKKENNSSNSFEFFTLPFEGLYSLVSPFLSKNSKVNEEKKTSNSATKDNIVDHENIRRGIVEDVWKVYSIHKKAHRFMQY